MSSSLRRKSLTPCTRQVVQWTHRWASTLKSSSDDILFESKDNIAVISINRPSHKNAVDRDTAQLLADAFRRFENDDKLHVAVLRGTGGTFCAGADLKAIYGGKFNRLEDDGDAPMGPSRMRFSKPVIAAISGHAVAGGLELACLCDLRVMEEDAVLGVFCRRFGVPLIDGGTVRLPRMIGLSRALDLILTGRPVLSTEALSIGLVNRVVPTGQSMTAALQLAREIASFPRECMLADRESVYEQSHLSVEDALKQEFQRAKPIAQGLLEKDGLRRFVSKEYKANEKKS